MVTCVSCLFFLALAAQPACAVASSIHVFPKSLDAQPDLRDQVVMMQQRSATFRHQLERLDVGRLHVQLRTDAGLLDRPFRGRSVIQKTTTARIVAWVTVTPFGDPTEWIAHELEHVIEQLEGVSVPQLARAGTEFAWRTTDNMYETERALRMGRVVLREVKDATRVVERARRSLEGSGCASD
jgi:hypothetical protein